MESPGNKTCEQVKKWVNETFKLPSSAEITVLERKPDEKESSLNVTDVTIPFRKDHPNTYTIPKPAVQITSEDIKHLQKQIELKIVKHHPVSGRFMRFFVWWFGLAAFYSMFAVCPFCGQAGCVVGVGGATVVGGITALLMQKGKAFSSFIYHKVFWWTDR